ncbi:MAG: PHP-associated domain-containing protein [Isosphaeraceae bacterium]|nr:PHP-associated domain-containing protein [Isosphaeraceae bacterium]
MPKFDHHLHTNRYSPDSVIDPLELIVRARDAGLDGVVITEHDVQWPEDELRELAEHGRRHNVLVFSGAEISAREGHFLVYGLPNLDDVPPGVALGDLLAAVKRCGAAVVAAHPFRWDQDFEAIVAEHGPVFDGLELVSNNVTPETRRRTEDLLRSQPMGVTGSSDGHDPEIVGCYYTELADPIQSLADFVTAVRQGRGRPRHRKGAPQASGPV